MARMVTVTGTYKRPDGSPASGSIVFKPSAWLRKQGDVVAPAQVVIDLSAQGTFSVVLPDTTQVGYQPAAFSYTVIEQIRGCRAKQWDCVLPEGQSTVDLGSLSPATISGVPVVLTPGPAGANGAPGPTGPAGPPGPGMAPATMVLRRCFIPHETNLNIGLTGDSTTNDTNDAPAEFFLWGLAQSGDTTTKLAHRRWNDATNSWDTLPDIQVGSQLNPPLVVSDTFTSATGELVGTAAEAGGFTYTGTTGGWSASGGFAVPSTVGKALSVPAGSPQVTLQARLQVVTTSPAAAQNLRLYIGGTTSGLGGTGLWCFLNLTTSGGVSIGVYKSIPGGTSLGAPTGSLGLVTNSATPQNIDVTLSLTGLTLTCTMVGPGGTATGTYTLNQSDVDVMGSFAGFYAANAMTNWKVDSWSVNRTEAPVTRTVTFWNGGVPGSTVALQTAKAATMFGQGVVGTLDAMILVNGHNFGAQSESAFLTAVNAWETAILAQQPGVPIYACSQNPQHLPAGNQLQHARRQVALRNLALQKGWGYAPIHEAFWALPDKGASLINSSDGIHPTTPTVGTVTDGFGSSFWGKKWWDAVKG